MLTIHQVKMAAKERAARIEKRERALFYWNEYANFDTIKDFAKYFELTLDRAIQEVTFGRRVNEEGVIPA